MSAIDRVTCPLITTPLSRTRLTRSLRTSLPVSRSSVSVIGSAREVIRGPRPGEVEPETSRLAKRHDFSESLLERTQTIGSDEKRRVENHRPRSVARDFRNRRCRGIHGYLGELL